MANGNGLPLVKGLSCLLAFLLTAGTAWAQNPVPFINQPLVPDAVKPGGAAFTLTVNGTGFVSGAVVKWNGSPRTTKFVSGSRLTAAISASDIATSRTASVMVVNPRPGGGTSNVAFLEITQPTSSVELVAVSYATADRSYSMAVGDFNGDGTLDLVVASYNTNTISVLLGNGDGTFQPHVDYATGSEPHSVVVGDFNGDGKLDLVVSNSGDNNNSVLLGNGDGTFQPAVNVGAGGSPGPVGDFNRDGKLDLAVGDGNNIKVLLGNGDGTFQPAVNVGAGGPGAVGDFNRDGKLDLVALNGNSISVLLGNGDGTFQPAVSYSAGSGQLVSVAVADFNADGKLDLVVSNNVTDNVSILLGNGDGTFQTHVDYGTESSNPLSVTVGDFNGDGTPDLVVADLFGTVHLLLGKGDGTFGAAASYAAGLDPSSIALGDFNDDGRLDIAVADSSTATVSVLLRPTVVSLSKPGLTFAAQEIHTSSAPQNVTLTNLGLLELSIESIAITGVDVNDFIQTNTCGSSLPSQGGSCTITVTFKPTLRGLRNAAVTITDNVVGGPQQIVLSGTGVVSGPSANLSPSSLIFATQLVGTTSPSQSVTLGDDGTAALTINSINLTGADPADFQKNTTCGSSVVPGASCTINVTFTPAQSGARTATLSIADNAPGSPQAIALSGVGAFPVTISLSKTALTFANQLVGTSSPSQTVTLTNGKAPLIISSIAVTGTNATDFSQTNTCRSGLPAGAKCTVTVTFAPTQTGPRNASITITDNAPGNPQSISLSGTGVVSGPNATLSSTSLTFARQLVGTTSPAQLITLTNFGRATLSISEITIKGSDPGDFAQTKTCGSTVAPGASCAINVTFKPTAINERTGSLSIMDNAPGSPQTIALSGAGTVVVFQPPDFYFGTVQAGRGTSTTITLTNEGNTTLGITGITITGSLAFYQTNNCNSIGGGQSCTITVFFDPQTRGFFSGDISISDDGGASPQLVPLSGRGCIKFEGGPCI